MLRLLIALMLLTLPTTPLATAQTPAGSFSDMPVMVLYCDDDPGRLNVGGGKSPAPQELIDSGLCTPAEGVALTFVLAEDEWDFEEDDPADEIEWDVQEDGWFDRCDMDAEGFCALNSPQGFDIVIGVVLHEGTVLPGYQPAYFQRGTHNYTEFTGWGLALIPSDEDAELDGTTADHQTLALNITHNGDPANALTEWQYNGEDSDTYLATNEGGWVSEIVAPDDAVEISLVNYDDESDVSVVCGANDDPDHVVEVNMDGDAFTVSVGDTTSDIRCDVEITD